MRFLFQAACLIDAEDIRDACRRIAQHFVMASNGEDGDLIIQGQAKISPVAIAPPAIPHDALAVRYMRADGSVWEKTLDRHSMKILSNVEILPKKDAPDAVM